MRIKRSDTLVLSFESDEFLFHNYLEKQTFSANETALDIVRRLRAWTEIDALVAALPGYSRESIVRSVDQLIELSAVVVEESEQADREEQFTTSWLWGPWAAAYHFSTKGGNFMSGEAAEAMLREQVKWNPSPPLHTPNPTAATPAKPSPTYAEPFLTMSRRRTNRVLLDVPIGLAPLSDCLLFSVAITAIMLDPDAVDLPLKMTPSGGGRNPYEAYVCVRKVDGLAPGTYHYSAMERSFAAISSEPPPPFPGLMAGQDWTAPAAAVIFLVANFERTMWKYHNASAYRVTMIEAGHIGQNIMLAATKHGLAANGTGAFVAAEVEAALGLTKLTQSVVYAIVLGVPGQAPAAIPKVA